MLYKVVDGNYARHEGPDQELKRYPLGSVVELTRDQAAKLGTQVVRYHGEDADLDSDRRDSRGEVAALPDAHEPPMRGPLPQDATRKVSKPSRSARSRSVEKR